MWECSCRLLCYFNKLDGRIQFKSSSFPCRDGTRNSSSLDPRGPGLFFTPRSPRNVNLPFLDSSIPREIFSRTSKIKDTFFSTFHMKLWLLTAISKKELTSVGSSNEVLQIIVLYCNYNLNMILQVLQWNLTWNVILI